MDGCIHPLVVFPIHPDGNPIDIYNKITLPISYFKYSGAFSIIYNYVPFRNRRIETGDLEAWVAGRWTVPLLIQKPGRRNSTTRHTQGFPQFF
jgi:hypothetical protein